MKIIAAPFENAFMIYPEPIQDDRGIFARIFCKKELSSIGFTKDIVQINHSMTVKRGAIRGMHFQYPPASDIKMVKCLRGSVFDVIIDIRKGSSTLLQWHGEVLSAENMKMIYVPEGFAHGFQTLEENSELLYFHAEVYSPEHEGGVRYDDHLIRIEWPLEVSNISNKDQRLPLLSKDFEGIVF